MSAVRKLKTEAIDPVQILQIHSLVKIYNFLQKVNA